MKTQHTKTYGIQQKQNREGNLQLQTSALKKRKILN